MSDSPMSGVFKKILFFCRRSYHGNTAGLKRVRHRLILLKRCLYIY